MNIIETKLTDGGLSLLLHKLVPFNRKAIRLGLEPVTVNVVRTEERTWTDTCKVTHTERINYVEVVGGLPRINGWTVAARIEFTGTEAGNFVIAAPGVTGLDAWRHVENRCDHCGHNRNRRDLIVIRHEDGSEKVVGRNCLADYIRTTDAAGLVEYCDWVAKLNLLASEAESEFWAGDGWGRCEPGYKMATLLQAASLCVRKLGWVSATAAFEAGHDGSTKNDVLYLLNGGRTRNAEALRSYNYWIEKNDLYLSDQDAAEAEAAAEWLAAIKPEGDYLHNLCVLRELDYVPASKVGIAVSVIVAAKRAREEEIKRREYAKKSEGREFIGEIKQRLRDLEVTVKRVRSLPGDFGVTTIITFECGNCELTWFASGDKTAEFTEGESYVVDATVKDHKDDPRFGKSTVVNRVSKKLSKVA